MKRKIDEREAQVMAGACQWALAAMYLVLFPSVVVKAFLLRLPAGYFITDALALILGGIALLVRSGSQGVFDTRMKFTAKNVLLVSLVPAAVVAVTGCIGLAGKYEQFQGEWGTWNLFLAGAALFAFTYVGALLLFLVYGAWSGYRAHKLEELNDTAE